MSEWSGHTPNPYVRLIDGPEMTLLFRSLEERGWVEVVSDDLSEVVGDRRRFRWLETETLLEVRDQSNALYVKLLQQQEDSKERLLMESDWISVNRLIALLDVMGIRRADDGWVSWWRAQLWG